MIRRITKYLLLKLRYHSLCKFKISTNISIRSTFERKSQIHPYTTFHGHLGFGSYIGEYCSLSAEIGKFTSIAPHVRSNCGTHPYKEPYVTTSPCFFSLNPNKQQCGSTFATKLNFKELRYYNEEKKIGVKIGSDCWVGEGVFIVGGVEISDGAIVLAHAVVTKNVPPYAIVGGVPAKIIEYRYDKETIEFLLKIKWWNNPTKWLKDNWEILSDINILKSYYKDNEIINQRT